MLSANVVDINNFIVEELIDGEEFATFENAEENRYAFGNKGIGFNVIRSTEAAQSNADDMDVYITNIALGKSYDDSLLDNLTFAQ